MAPAVIPKRVPKAISRWYRTALTSIDGRLRIYRAPKVTINLKALFEKARRNGRLGAAPSRTP